MAGPDVPPGGARHPAGQRRPVRHGPGVRRRLPVQLAPDGLHRGPCVHGTAGVAARGKPLPRPGQGPDRARPGDRHAPDRRCAADHAADPFGAPALAAGAHRRAGLRRHRGHVARQSGREPTAGVPGPAGTARAGVAGAATLASLRPGAGGRPRRPRPPDRLDGGAAAQRHRPGRWRQQLVEDAAARSRRHLRRRSRHGARHVGETRPAGPVARRRRGEAGCHPATGRGLAGRCARAGPARRGGGPCPLDVALQAVAAPAFPAAGVGAAGPGPPGRAHRQRERARPGMRGGIANPGSAAAIARPVGATRFPATDDAAPRRRALHRPGHLGVAPGRRHRRAGDRHPGPDQPAAVGAVAGPRRGAGAVRAIGRGSAGGQRHGAAGPAALRAVRPGRLRGPSRQPQRLPGVDHARAGAGRGDEDLRNQSAAARFPGSSGQTRQASTACQLARTGVLELG